MSEREIWWFIERTYLFVAVLNFHVIFAGKPWGGVGRGRGEKKSPLWGLFHIGLMYFLKWMLVEGEKSAQHSRHVKEWPIFCIWYSILWGNGNVHGRRRKVYLHLAAIWIQLKAKNIRFPSENKKMIISSNSQLYNGFGIKISWWGKIGQSISVRNFENVVFIRLNFLDRFDQRYTVLLDVLIPSHNPLKLFPSFMFDSYIYCKWQH